MKSLIREACYVHGWLNSNVVHFEVQVRTQDLQGHEGITKAGELQSGSGKWVTNRKQAVAIALNEARRKGAKIPRKPGNPSRRKAVEGRPFHIF